MISKEIHSDNPESYFDKSTTNIIKGIALIFMFIHHMFTFPDAYIDGISYPALEPYAKWLCTPFNMCVAIFAFLTGYCYFFCKEKNCHYAFRKITDVLITYWFVYIPFLVIALFLGNYNDFSLKSFALELFALNRPIMVFCWYIPFYIISMLVLTFAAKYSQKNLIGLIIFMLILPVMCPVILAKFVGNSVIAGNLENVSEWFPCIGIGYICASCSLFKRFDKLMNLFRYKWIKLIVYIVLGSGVFLARHYLAKVTLFTIYLLGRAVSVSIFMDVVYTPIFVYSIINIIRMIPIKKFWNLIGEIGKYSLYMWFLHCIFFNVSKNIFQPILYWPKNPILVVLWGLLLCYVAARLIDIPLKRLLINKNNILGKLGHSV